jgi:hypothetical protein
MSNQDKLAAKDESIENYSGYGVDCNDCDL